MPACDHGGGKDGSIGYWNLQTGERVVLGFIAIPGNWQFMGCLFITHGFIFALTRGLATLVGHRDAVSCVALCCSEGSEDRTC